MKNTASKKDLEAIIEKLGNRFPNLEAFLLKKKSIESEANLLRETQLIPEIITIRYLTILTEETITTGILGDINSISKDKYNKRISLLNEISHDFKSSIVNIPNAISNLNEGKNIFYISKQVIAEVEAPNGSIFSHKGVLILGLHYLMFFPTKELEDFIDFEKLEELLDKITEEVPLLNFGISIALLLKNIYKDTTEESSMFSEKLKEKMTKLFNEKKGFIIKYFDIEKVRNAGVAKRILGAAKFSIFSSNSFTYNFWKLKDNLDLMDTLFEKTISLSLMNGNMILPKNLSDRYNFTSYYRVP